MNKLFMILMLSLMAEPAVADDNAWYVIRISGSVVGTASEKTIQQGADELSSQHMDLRMSRMGVEIEMFLSGTELTDRDGRLKSYSATFKASVAEQSFSGFVRNDTLYHTTTAPGFSQTQALLYEAGAVGSAGYADVVRKGLKAGADTVRARVFDPQQGKFKTQLTIRQGKQAVSIAGEEMAVLVVKEYEGGNSFPTSESWLDDNYEVIRTTISQLGLEIVLDRATAEEIAELEIEPNFDVIRESMIPCSGYPESLDGIREVKLRLDFMHPIPADIDFAGPNQRVTQRGDDWIEVRISRDVIGDMSQDDVSAGYTESDRHIQSEHPSIKETAAHIRESVAGNKAEIPQAASEWVNRYITEKGYGSGFASALEVLDSKSGDCTEHSVLLTALLRANGIPSRPAVGLVYHQGQFVGHMWAEAFSEGWKSYDALDLEGRPIRFRVAAGQDGEAVDPQALIDVYTLVGGMKARVIDVIAE